jgi:cytochrome P450
MSVRTCPNVFDAGLPTIDYDVTAPPEQVFPQALAAQRLSPIALGPLGPELLSYELARTALRDSRFRIPPGYILSVQGITSGPLWDKVAASLLGLGGAEHQRVRSVVSKAFTPRAVQRLHDTIVGVIDEIVEPVSRRGHCDIVTDIARPYPVPIICALLGAPREDWQRFSDWTDQIFRAFSFPFTPDEVPDVMRAWGELDDYVDDMVARRRHTLTDDLLSDLIRIEHDGDRLTGDELRMLAAALLMAGTDTTRNQVAASVDILCDHPDQWELLRRSPDLALGAVDELVDAGGHRRRRARGRLLPGRHDGVRQYRCGQS